jgi:hypothetical protein
MKKRWKYVSVPGHQVTDFGDGKQAWDVHYCWSRGIGRSVHYGLAGMPYDEYDHGYVHLLELAEV